MRYFYGSLVANNYTYEYSTYVDRMTPGYNNEEYTIWATAALAQDPNYISSYNPIASLGREDADTALFFLSANSIKYLTPVDDPWYGAHQTFPEQIGIGPTQGGHGTIITMYYRDEIARALGCTIQHQYCNSAPGRNRKCTNLTALNPLTTEALSLWDTDMQIATAQSLTSTFYNYMATIASVPPVLHSSALLARGQMFSTVQPSLPSDQWQKEVKHWHDIQLATLQRAVLDEATEASNSAVVPYLILPRTQAEHRRCNNQKIRSTAYASFSTLGLTVVFVIGGLIIILSYTIEWIFERVERWRGLPTYQRLEWVTNESLQLQRLAHEELGYGNWSGTDRANPVTEFGEDLAILNIEDTTHPTLMVVVSEGPRDTETTTAEQEKASGGITAPIPKQPLTTTFVDDRASTEGCGLHNSPIQGDVSSHSSTSRVSQLQHDELPHTVDEPTTNHA